MSKSNSTHVLLKTTDLNTEGTYMAEVSTTTFKSVKSIQTTSSQISKHSSVKTVNFSIQVKKVKDLRIYGMCH
jgi:hypothetical protein